MEIRKERVGDVHVVTTSGRLDGIYSTAFANQVGELLTEPSPKILIDFTDIEFVTSSGLRVLLILIKKAQAAGGFFAVCGPNDQVRDVLDIGVFPPIFSIHRGRVEGIAALNAGREDAIRPLSRGPAGEAR
jgi:anti-sigma B factor antagonist